MYASAAIAAVTATVYGDKTVPGALPASEALTSGSRVSTDDSRQADRAATARTAANPGAPGTRSAPPSWTRARSQPIDDPPASTQSAPSGSMSTHGETLARATSTTQPSSISPQSATERARPGCWTSCRTDRTSCSRHSSTRSHAPSVTLSRSAGTSSR